MLDTKELVRLFNEDEAVWRAFEKKRALRRQRRPRPPMSEHILDRLDWQAAERENRPVRAIGYFYP